MFKRYPYWGWLVLTILLWCAVGYHYYAQNRQLKPEVMAQVVTQHLQHQEQECNLFLQDTGLLRSIYNNSLDQQQVAALLQKPFYLYLFHKDSLLFWNNNNLLARAIPELTHKTFIRKRKEGVFIRSAFQVGAASDSNMLVVLYLVYNTYPLENEYLKSHFVASPTIPNTAIFSEKHISSSFKEFPIYLKNNKEIGILSINEQDIQRWVPDSWFLSLLVSALLLSMTWIQLMAIHINRNRSPLVTFGIIFGIVMLIRLMLFRFGLPFHLDALPIFSPLLYASSNFLSSLGDLFINIILLVWLIILVFKHTPYTKILLPFKHKKSGIFIAVLLCSAFTFYGLLFGKIVRSLVLDSSISFDVSHFYAINIYTGFGMLAVVAVVGITCLILYMLHKQLRLLLPHKWVVYLVFVLVYSALLFLTGRYDMAFNWYLLLVFMVFIMLLDVPGFPLVSKVFEPHMILWGIILCCFSTFFIRYYNELKEERARLAFVDQHLSPKRDDLLEYSFERTATIIANDSVVRNYLLHPTATARAYVNERINVDLLSGQYNRYDAEIALFGSSYESLFNIDSTEYETLKFEQAEADTTSSPYLFYMESVLGKQHYKAYIPVDADSLGNRAGYIYIDFELKKSAVETVYPLLLQPNGLKQTNEDKNYAYAIYNNSKLISHTNDYPFEIKLGKDSLQVQKYKFYNINGNKALRYKVDDKRTVLVVHYHNELLEAVTLFSYVFGIQMLLAILVLLYQLFLSYLVGALYPGWFLRVTLKRRVHMAMFSVVILSFLIIGYVTIKFFTNEYQVSNTNNLKNALHAAKLSVVDYLEEEDAFRHKYIYDSVTRSTDFHAYIEQLATNQKIDINIYDVDGNLFATSQSEIYDKALLAKKMRPDAYFTLTLQSNSFVVQNEMVASLSYTSAYEPLRNEDGAIMGYINVPFFTSKKDFDFQISSLLITLSNIYAFIFLISGFITLFLTRWITRTFDIIIKQFDKLNLQANDLLVWPYDDEIGRLVMEYNKMVKKVEEHAAKLAQSERESAWREMARQVAHEIKNPLTPMKLNIQYLQQATRNDNPNIKALTERLSSSIIEQIDNLSYIASEFSNFAKMPEAQPERLELGALLTMATELYQNIPHLNLQLSLPFNEYYIVCDKSQMLRVFANLLENAKQAIPDDREGHILVSLEIQPHLATIKVTDNGIGISEEVGKRLFQPYFTTKSSGTGLGLAMTKKIIEFWKGTITFESVEQEGTVFIIQLPI